MPTYHVKVSYTYTGTYTINAEHPEQAQVHAEKHCAMSMHNGIHTVLQDEIVPDWNFPMIPDCTVVSIQELTPNSEDEDTQNRIYTTLVTYELSQRTNLLVADWNVPGDDNDTVELFDSNEELIGTTTVDLLEECITKAETQL